MYALNIHYFAVIILRNLTAQCWLFLRLEVEDRFPAELYLVIFITRGYFILRWKMHVYARLL